MATSTEPPLSPTTTAVTSLVSKLHSNIDLIHQTLQSLFALTSSHDAEIDRLSIERETTLSELKSSYEKLVHGLEVQREKEAQELKVERENKEREVEEERRREWEAILERRRVEDEERRGKIEEEERVRKEKKEEEDKLKEIEREEMERRVREQVEMEMEKLEDETERVVGEGKNKLAQLDDLRKEINKQIDMALNPSIAVPEIKFRSRAKTNSKRYSGIEVGKEKGDGKLNGDVKEESFLGGKREADDGGTRGLETGNLSLEENFAVPKDTGREGGEKDGDDISSPPEVETSKSLAKESTAPEVQELPTETKSAEPIVPEDHKESTPALEPEETGKKIPNDQPKEEETLTSIEPAEPTSSAAENLVKPDVRESSKEPPQFEHKITDSESPSADNLSVPAKDSAGDAKDIEAREEIAKINEQNLAEMSEPEAGGAEIRDDVIEDKSINLERPQPSEPEPKSLAKEDTQEPEAEIKIALEEKDFPKVAESEEGSDTPAAAIPDHVDKVTTKNEIPNVNTEQDHEEPAPGIEETSREIPNEQSKEPTPEPETEIQSRPSTVRWEDPEDIKAREEIARMNAEFMAAMKEEEEEESRKADEAKRTEKERVEKEERDRNVELEDKDEVRALDITDHDTPKQMPEVSDPNDHSIPTQDSNIEVEPILPAETTEEFSSKPVQDQTETSDVGLIQQVEKSTEAIEPNLEDSREEEIKDELDIKDGEWPIVIPTTTSDLNLEEVETSAPPEEIIHALEVVEGVTGDGLALIDNIPEKNEERRNLKADTQEEGGEEHLRELRDSDAEIVAETPKDEGDGLHIHTENHGSSQEPSSRPQPPVMTRSRDLPLENLEHQEKAPDLNKTESKAREDITHKEDPGNPAEQPNKLDNAQPTHDQPESPVSVQSTKGIPGEDPEDVKAREEIARLNAELMAAAMEEEQEMERERVERERQENHQESPEDIEVLEVMASSRPGIGIEQEFQKDAPEIEEFNKYIPTSNDEDLISPIERGRSLQIKSQTQPDLQFNKPSLSRSQSPSKKSKPWEGRPLSVDTILGLKEHIERVTAMNNNWIPTTPPFDKSHPPQKSPAFQPMTEAEVKLEEMNRSALGDMPRNSTGEPLFVEGSGNDGGESKPWEERPLSVGSLANLVAAAAVERSRSPVRVGTPRPWEGRPPSVGTADGLKIRTEDLVKLSERSGLGTPAFEGYKETPDIEGPEMTEEERELEERNRVVLGEEPVASDGTPLFAEGSRSDEARPWEGRPISVSTREILEGSISGDEHEGQAEEEPSSEYRPWEGQPLSIGTTNMLQSGTEQLTTQAEHREPTTPAFDGYKFRDIDKEEESAADVLLTEEEIANRTVLGDEPRTHDGEALFAGNQVGERPWEGRPLSIGTVEALNAAINLPIPDEEFTTIEAPEATTGTSKPAERFETQPKVQIEKTQSDTIPPEGNKETLPSIPTEEPKSEKLRHKVEVDQSLERPWECRPLSIHTSLILQNGTEDLLTSTFKDFDDPETPPFAGYKPHKDDEDESILDERFSPEDEANKTILGDEPRTHDGGKLFASGDDRPWEERPLSRANAPILENNFVDENPDEARPSASPTPEPFQDNRIFEQGALTLNELDTPDPESVIHERGINNGQPFSPQNISETIRPWEGRPLPLSTSSTLDLGTSTITAPGADPVPTTPAFEGYQPRDLNEVKNRDDEGEDVLTTAEDIWNRNVLGDEPLTHDGALLFAGDGVERPWEEAGVTNSGAVNITRDIGEQPLKEVESPPLPEVQKEQEKRFELQNTGDEDYTKDAAPIPVDNEREEEVVERNYEDEILMVANAPSPIHKEEEEQTREHHVSEEQVHIVNTVLPPADKELEEDESIKLPYTEVGEPITQTLPPPIETEEESPTPDSQAEQEILPSATVKKQDPTPESHIKGKNDPQTLVEKEEVDSARQVSTSENLIEEEKFSSDRPWQGRPLSINTAALLRESTAESLAPTDDTSERPETPAFEGYIAKEVSENDDDNVVAEVWSEEDEKNRVILEGEPRTNDGSQLFAPQDGERPWEGQPLSDGAPILNEDLEEKEPLHLTDGHMNELSENSLPEIPSERPWEGRPLSIGAAMAVLESTGKELEQGIGRGGVTPASQINEEDDSRADSHRGTRDESGRYHVVDDDEPLDGVVSEADDAYTDLLGAPGTTKPWEGRPVSISTANALKIGTERVVGADVDEKVVMAADRGNSEEAEGEGSGTRDLPTLRVSEGEWMKAGRPASRAKYNPSIQSEQDTILRPKNQAEHVEEDPLAYGFAAYQEELRAIAENVQRFEEQIPRDSDDEDTGVGSFVFRGRRSYNGNRDDVDELMETRGFEPDQVATPDEILDSYLPSDEQDETSSTYMTNQPETTYYDVMTEAFPTLTPVVEEPYQEMAAEGSLPADPTKQEEGDSPGDVFATPTMVPTSDFPLPRTEVAELTPVPEDTKLDEFRPSPASISELRPRTPENQVYKQHVAESPVTVLNSEDLFDDESEDDEEADKSYGQAYASQFTIQPESARDIQSIATATPDSPPPLPRKSSNRDSGMFASLVNTIRSDVPLVRQILSGPSYDPVTGCHDDYYSASGYSHDTPEEVAHSRNSSGAYDEWQPKVETSRGSLKNEEDDSLRVRSHTVDTVPSFDGNSGPSTPSDAPSSPVLEECVAEPDVQTWPGNGQNEGVEGEDTNQELNPKASPMLQQTEFDPFNTQNYAPHFSPAPTQTTFHIEPQKTISTAPYDQIALPSTQGSVSPNSFMRSRAMDTSAISPSPLDLSSRNPYKPNSPTKSPSPRSKYAPNYSSRSHPPFPDQDPQWRSVSSPLPKSPSRLPSRPSVQTDRDRSSTITNYSRTPVQSPSIPSNSIFQKTRSLFESAATSTSPKQAPIRPLSGIFHVGRAKGPPPPVPPKPKNENLGRTNSISSIRSQSSLRRSETVEYNEDEDGAEMEIVPRSLDGNGRPPSPVFSLQGGGHSRGGSRSSLSAERERKGSVTGSLYSGAGYGSSSPARREERERGLRDSVHNPNRDGGEGSPLLSSQDRN